MLLLDAGADPNYVARGFSTLMILSERSSHSIIKLLLDSGADPNFVAVRISEYPLSSQNLWRQFAHISIWQLLFPQPPETYALHECGMSSALFIAAMYCRPALQALLEGGEGTPPVW